MPMIGNARRFRAPDVSHPALRFPPCRTISPRMSETSNHLDPTGLIREAYRIEGLTAADARGIFFDWALGLGQAEDMVEAARNMLIQYQDEPTDHPMTEVLRAAVEGKAQARRRGGAMGRRRDP